MLIIKNPQFFTCLYETSSKWPSQNLVILLDSHAIWAEIVYFPSMVHFMGCVIFFVTVFRTLPFARSFWKWLFYFINRLMVGFIWLCSTWKWSLQRNSMMSSSSSLLLSVIMDVTISRNNFSLEFSRHVLCMKIGATQYAKLDLNENEI